MNLMQLFRLLITAPAVSILAMVIHYKLSRSEGAASLVRLPNGDEVIGIRQANGSYAVTVNGVPHATILDKGLKWPKS